VAAESKRLSANSAWFAASPEDAADILVRDHIENPVAAKHQEQMLLPVQRHLEKIGLWAQVRQEALVAEGSRQVYLSAGEKKKKILFK